MKLITKDLVEKQLLPGRLIRSAVGKGHYSPSGKITAGWARYSEESGKMEPHHHAEEIIYVIDARDSWVRWGPTKDDLPHKLMAEPGMLFHFPELEWHVFEYDPGGYMDVLFIYGQVENIRPEEIR